MAVAPKTAARIEENPTALRVVGILIATVASIGLYFGSKDRNESNNQIETLLAATTSQATALDVRNIRSDLYQLQSETTSGFESVVRAINSLAPLLGKGTVTAPPIQKPPAAIQAPSSPTEPPILLSPGIAQRLRVLQQRTVAVRSDAPFALQVILQINAPLEPTAFIIECNGEIESGSFFIAGASALMGVAHNVLPDKRHFYLEFEYPIFKPETPIVVTLSSKTEIRVIGVSWTNQLFR